MNRSKQKKNKVQLNLKFYYILIDFIDTLLMNIVKKLKPIIDCHYSYANHQLDRGHIAYLELNVVKLLLQIIS